jgi:hypothetical protein
MDKISAEQEFINALNAQNIIEPKECKLDLTFFKQIIAAGLGSELCSFCRTLSNVTDEHNPRVFCKSCATRLNKSGHQIIQCGHNDEFGNICNCAVYISGFGRAKKCKKHAYM